MALFKRDRFYWFSKNIGGKHYRESTGCTQRDKAERFYAQWLLEHNHVTSQAGDFYQQPQVSSLTLEQLLDMYFKDSSFTKLAPGSQRRYRTSAKLFVEKFGPNPINRITPLMLGDLKKERKSQGIQPATTDRDFAFLKHLYNWAIERELCEKNPVKGFLFEKPDNARKRRFSEEEEILVLQEAKRQGLDWFFTITVLGIYTRGRRAEIVNLRREDIDLEEKTISYMVTKNKTPRIEPLCEKAHMALETWMKNKKFSPQDYIFPGITADRVTRVHIRIAGKLGIQNLWFHDTGRTFTNRLMEARTDIFPLSKLSGHKNIETLLKHYLNPNISTVLREEVAKLDTNVSRFVTILESGKK